MIVIRVIPEWDYPKSLQRMFAQWSLQLPIAEKMKFVLEDTDKGVLQIFPDLPSFQEALRIRKNLLHETASTLFNPSHLEKVQNFLMTHKMIPKEFPTQGLSLKYEFLQDSDEKIEEIQRFWFFPEIDPGIEMQNEQEYKIFHVHFRSLTSLVKAVSLFFGDFLSNLR